MRKLARRLDKYLHQKLTWQTFAAVTLTMLLLLSTWALILNQFGVVSIRGQGQIDTPAINLETSGPNKTLGDWLTILFEPLILIAAGIWLANTLKKTLEGIAARRTQQEIQSAEQDRQTQVQIAQDSQREAAFRDYLDKMEAALLSGGLPLGKNPEDLQRREVARLRTITTIRRLDRQRANEVFQFLRDAGLGLTILVGAELQNANLESANLSQIRLRKADLSWSNLQRAFMQGTDLNQARLYDSDLVRSMLIDANIRGADLCMADLTEANLTRADLTGASLNRANLNRAILRDAILIDADLSHADMINADMGGANLSGAKVSEHQLNSTRCLSGAILPDGSPYEDGEPVSSADVDTGNWRKGRKRGRRTASNSKTNVWNEPEPEITA